MRREPLASSTPRQLHLACTRRHCATRGNYCLPPVQRVLSKARPMSWPVYSCPKTCTVTHTTGNHLSIVRRFHPQPPPPPREPLFRNKGRAILNLCSSPLCCASLAAKTPLATLHSLFPDTAELIHATVASGKRIRLQSPSPTPQTRPNSTLFIWW